MGRILVMSLLACSFYNNSNINSLLFYVLFLHSGYGAHSPLQRKQSKHNQSKFAHAHSNNRETERETDRQTDRDRERETERETERVRESVSLIRAEVEMCG